MGFPSATQPNNRAALRWVIDQNQIWCGVREQGGALYLGLGLSPASICFNRFGRSFVRMWGRSSPQKLRPPKRPFSWVLMSARFLFRDGGKRRGDIGAGDLSHLISYAYATDQGAGKRRDGTATGMTLYATRKRATGRFIFQFGRLVGRIWEASSEHVV
jgi:hypothetical protein